MSLLKLEKDQEMLLNLAEEFSIKEIRPHAEELDRNKEFPREIFEKARKLGLLGLTIPEEYGGGGQSHVTFLLTTERLAKACSGITGAISLNTLISDAILVGGSEQQKKNYLDRLQQGQIGSYALTEPGAGSDVAAIQTQAVKHGATYKLNGAKTWISNATVADFFVVFAKTDSQAGHKGITAFLVDKDTPGLTLGKEIEKLGQRAFPAAEVFLDNVEIPSSHLLGKEGQGFYIAMGVFDRSRPMVAALGVGLAQRCLEESLHYSKTRHTMGKPLHHHQLIAVKIAEMGMRTQAARWLTLEAGALLDQKSKNTLAAAYAKAFAGDTAVWASSEAVQVFGGMGMSTEYPVEKLYRDSKVLQIYEGTNEIQRLIMARELAQSLP